MKISFLLSVFSIILMQSNAQNVGIGIANPTRSRLEINGVVGRTVGIFGGDGTGVSLQRGNPGIGFNHYHDGADNRAIGAGYSAASWFNPSHGFWAFDILSYAGPNAVPSSIVRAMTIEDNGYIGISGANPNSMLQFPNTLSNRKLVLWESAGNNNQFFGFGMQNGTLTYYVDASAAAHKFYAGTGATTSNLLMTIAGNRKVMLGIQGGTSRLGINSQDPVYTLEVVQTGNKGMILINPANGYHNWELRCNTYSVNASDALSLYYDEAASPKGWFRPTDGGYTANSDRRLKRDISDIGSVLPKIMKLQPAQYKFIMDKEQKNSLGFIAQDLEPYFPELVDVRNFSEEGALREMRGINYAGLGVIAIKAIQEQQETIEALERQVKELNEKIQILLNRK